MKLFKVVLVALVLLVNLVIAPASWADRPKLTNTPEYTEVTQAINSLLQVKSAPNRSGLAPDEIEQQLGELKLQKYILETATEWAQCRNNTGKTLAVYAHKAKKAAQPSTLYYLGSGKITDDDWNCDGVYLPSGALIANRDQPLAEPLALKVTPGTQLIAKNDPETGLLEFNVNPAQVFRAGETNWSIPNLSQANIDAKVPNAPIED
ncbi:MULTISPECIES: hypothetical protein [Trichocoleus]|uniref:Uncharacterized protein n=1 Tax=Trichocoleus desertorum GB2-A4 TaxID=2933944 RepID=A0ABV0JCE9_9CYAN|nr:hypothetical protein [Trichocoleus sp. FACHB-46]MBD1864115.1 hypothetical protein [Trichocoleus sp. FACHB-46]